MRFVDQATINVRAGSGGAGCISFRREKFVPKGGPDGGDGGDGGSVVLVGNRHLQTLADLEYRRSYRAERGGNGAGANRHGRNGADVRVPVPLGTDVFNVDTGAKLGEVLAPDQELVVARGGRGGRGNTRFVSSTNQAPRRADGGEPVADLKMKLVLRLLADVGIVGLPNVGKSTLLSKLTRARPKVADYPFTTLSPNLGMMETRHVRFTVADMPGIIEGASEGKGLGLWFLRHIERTRVLVFVLDAANGNPRPDYAALLEEIRNYNPQILERPRVVALNKQDIREETDEAISQVGDEFDVPAVRVSALTGEGVDELRTLVARSVPSVQ